MALFSLTVNADLRRVAVALERIAMLLNWHLALRVDPRIGPVIKDQWAHVFEGVPEPQRKRAEEPITTTGPTDEERWEKEQESLRRKAAAETLPR